MTTTLPSGTYNVTIIPHNQFARVDLGGEVTLWRRAHTYGVELVSGAPSHLGDTQTAAYRALYNRPALS